jgi:hypothetical protein
MDIEELQKWNEGRREDFALRAETAVALGWVRTRKYAGSEECPLVGTWQKPNGAVAIWMAIPHWEKSIDAALFALRTELNEIEKLDIGWCAPFEGGKGRWSLPNWMLFEMSPKDICRAIIAVKGGKMKPLDERKIV